ncbi:MAG: LamG-like jellyroll fold domain-containing protein, partial [Gammaproteobacteria bacterium]
AGSEELLIELPFNASKSSGSHNGGALEFGADDKLYVTTGDGWSGGDPVQSLDTYTGKLLRIGADGSLPMDNPFYDHKLTAGPHRAIYALGLRNPFSMSFNPNDGKLYINDAVGTKKATVYIVEASANYGHQGHSNIGKRSLPWANASGAGGVLITGGAWYPLSGGPFPAEYRGVYFVAMWGSNSQSTGDINYIDPASSTADDPKSVRFAGRVGESVGGDFTKPVLTRVGPAGNLYYMLTDYEVDSGSIHVIRPTAVPAVNTPTIDPDSGSYEQAIEVTLSTRTGGATIHFTTDGKQPTQQSTLYSGPIRLAADALVRARAYKPGLAPSAIAEARYTIGESVNIPPVADAGPDQVVAVNRLVTLNGSASFDPDGSALDLSTHWTQLAGDPVNFFSDDDEVAFFTPSEIGTYRFRHTVSDGKSEDSDDAIVEVLECVDDVTDGLVTRLSFNEGVGSTALDTSANANNGELDGTTWSTDTPDASDYSLQFDGIDDEVALGGLDVASTAATFSAWVNFRDFKTMDGRIVSKANGVSEQDHWWMLSTIATAGEHRLRFRLKTGTGTTTLIASRGALSLDSWRHVAATYDGRRMRLYLDGAQVGETEKSGTIASGVNVQVSIGNQPGGAGTRAIAAKIDDVRIYDRALTATELDIVRNRTGACPPPNSPPQAPTNLQVQ